MLTIACRALGHQIKTQDSLGQAVSCLLLLFGFGEGAKLCYWKPESDAGVHDPFSFQSQRSRSGSTCCLHWKGPLFNSLPFGQRVLPTGLAPGTSVTVPAALPLPSPGQFTVTLRAGGTLRAQKTQVFEEILTHFQDRAT